MTTKFLSTGLIAVLSLVPVSCATIKLTEEGTKARVMGLDEVKKCQNQGSVTVSLNPKTLNVVRKSSHRVTSQLQILARNSAIHMEGDTVVPMSRFEYEQQTFEVFRCMP